MALKNRLSKVAERENSLNHRTFLKRNTQRYTEMSSVGGEDVALSDVEDVYSSGKTSARSSERYSERRITGDSGELVDFQTCIVKDVNLSTTLYSHR